jgi:hypothetical protein
LLYLKWTQAENAKRHLQIQTQGDIDLKPEDLVMPVLRGVGILLDNALEAINVGQSAAVLLVADVKHVAITVINPVPADFTLQDLTKLLKAQATATAWPLFKSSAKTNASKPAPNCIINNSPKV